MWKWEDPKNFDVHGHEHCQGTLSNHAYAWGIEFYLGRTLEHIATFMHADMVFMEMWGDWNLINMWQ